MIPKPLLLRRLPMPPYRILRGFLDDETRAALLAFSIANEARFRATATAGGEAGSTIRRSLSLRTFDPLETMLRRRVGGLVHEWIADLRVNPFEPAAIELELVAHTDGAFFARHLDSELGAYDPEKSARMLSGVYYFHAQPKAFGGGALRLYRFGPGERDGVDIEPDDNTFVVYPSWASHEVMPVTCPSRRFSDSRFAVNCWIHR